jgi:hypothetical protein
VTVHEMFVFKKRRKMKGVYQYDAGAVILTITGRPALSIAVLNSFKSEKNFCPSFSAPLCSVPGYSSLTRGMDEQPVQVVEY